MHIHKISCCQYEGVVPTISTTGINNTVIVRTRANITVFLALVIRLRAITPACVIVKKNEKFCKLATAIATKYEISNIVNIQFEK